MSRQSEYTYFVFYKVEGEYIDTPQQYEARCREYGSTISWSEAALEVFPLCEARVVSLSRKLDVTSVDLAIADVTAVPSCVQTVVAPPPGASVNQLYDSSITFDGKPLPRRKMRPASDFTKSEIIACAHDEIVTSARALAGTEFSFLTSRRSRRYVRLECNVELFVKYWIELRGCLDAYDEVYASPDSWVGDPTSQINRFMFSHQKGLEASLRARFEEGAANNGPKVGSFVPCTIVEPFAHSNHPCVLQIVTGPTRGEHLCVLHVLCEEAGICVTAGTRILHMLVLHDPTAPGGSRHSMCELGVIREILR